MRAAVFLALLIAVTHVAAQQGGFVSGSVHDRTGAVIIEADIQVQNEWTGARLKIGTDGQGHFATSPLSPGPYKITVRKHGFRTVAKSAVGVQAAITRVVDFYLDLLPLQQEVTVQESRDDADPATDGLSMSRQSGTVNLPANGRDLHSLFSLIPGAVVTPAAVGDGGQFTVGGQRPNTNSFRVDGVSGNTGIGVSAIAGSFPGSTLPGMTAIGSTQNLSSKEETDHVELRSSSFAPESGDRPGAQIAIVTRSGSNDLHGSLFGYVRPSSWNGYDWFAQSCEVSLARPSVAGYGASLGGPIARDRTFFFASFEQSAVKDSALQLISVPSLAARAAAPNRYQSILKAFPLPTGCHLNAEESVGTLAMRKQARVSSYGLRLDQALGDRANLFFRFSEVPSSSQTDELGSGSDRLNWRSATLGFSVARDANRSHDVRLNFSRADARSEWGSVSDPGQAAISEITNALPLTPSAGSQQITGVSVAGVGQFISGQRGRSFQNQLEGSYTISQMLGSHEIRTGGDYIRLSPRRDKPIQTVSVVSGGVQNLIAGAPLDVTVSSVLPQSVDIQIASFFAQDNYRVTDRLNLLYGVRWELTPPVSAQQVSLPYVGFWNGPGTQPNWVGSVQNLDRSVWPTRYGQFAPRVGLAYRLKGQRDLVFRAGAGLFYDTGLGSAIDPVNGAPFTGWQFSSSPGVFNAPLFLTLESTASPVPLAAAKLRLPSVLEWRASLQKTIASKALIALSYSGSAGRNLLRQQAYLSPQSQILQSLELTSLGSSSYQALQANLSGNLTPHLYVLVSYTWGHSIDNGSQGSAIFLSRPAYNARIDRGSSDFDVRHTAMSSFSYRVAPSLLPTPVRSLAGNWNLSSTVQSRTGFPIDISGVDRSLGLGFDNNSRPDLVLGRPIWISNGLAPGGRQINPWAFAPHGEAAQGTLGRNVLTGNGLFQIDASLHRRFQLFSASSVEVSASAFNLLNHPEFANPVRYLFSPWFGHPTSMASLMLGSGSPNAGLTPIFQAGGPRSLEINFRFSF